MIHTKIIPHYPFPKIKTYKVLVKYVLVAENSTDWLYMGDTKKNIVCPFPSHWEKWFYRRETEEDILFRKELDNATTVF